MAEGSIYDRLGRMAVAHALVVDTATVPGKISIEIKNEDWQREPRSADLGYIDMYISRRSRSGFVENVIVVLARAIVDTNIEVGDLFDFVESEARALPGWLEQSAVREPSRPRSVGAAVQSGCYRDAGQG